ncbi:hypothetical protein BKA67DRAFT_539642 [Truncatella angustata]|uniref:Uncharacterized protein n=1 Tax=Truncatella angustata TaxID=152316 RepID=A0A9P8UD74_9PEZI|nr:uncharacterized protein BKA67DRAFT_539642 [Truncatella angustata]KAH6647798.1 hypothetical protein BKA67DRAFT_539642 [Truncatella angustata]
MPSSNSCTLPRFIGHVATVSLLMAYSGINSYYAWYINKVLEPTLEVDFPDDQPARAKRVFGFILLTALLSGIISIKAFLHGLQHSRNYGFWRCSVFCNIITAFFSFSSHLAYGAIALWYAHDWQQIISEAGGYGKGKADYCHYLVVLRAFEVALGGMPQKEQAMAMASFDQTGNRPNPYGDDAAIDAYMVLNWSVWWLHAGDWEERIGLVSLTHDS